MKIGIGLPAAVPDADALRTGVAEIGRAWQRAGRAGRPRVVVPRYFCLGPGARERAEHYLQHYYGEADLVLADTPTSRDHLDAELHRLRAAGAADVVLLPCTDDVTQVGLLAGALDALGVTAAPPRTLPPAPGA